MHKNISKEEFMDAFDHAGRFSQFGYLGLSALYDGLLELEEGGGYSYECDAIAICCDFAIYESWGCFIEDYDGIENMEQLQALTHVIPLDDGSFIVQAY